MANVTQPVWLTFRLLQTFFGLSEEYQENVYEEFFLLKHHGGWSFIEAYNLPISLRHWFLKRLTRHFEEEKQQIQNSKNKSR